MKQEKLDFILDAAKKMFGRYGVEKTSMDEIARMARVAKATIYNYFGSKDRVYMEVLRREVHEIVAGISSSAEKKVHPTEEGGIS
jgi:AcrR family transcriptional regulator